MRALPALLPLLLLLATCGPIPRDPENTLDRVRETHRIRVGLVVGDTDPAWSPLLARIDRTTGARPMFDRGALEPLLLRLEKGELDLVAGGTFARDTPWTTRVTLGPMLRAEGPVEHHLVARNGENAWIMLIEREARTLGHER